MSEKVMTTKPVMTPKTRNILLVEDDVSLCLSLRNFLRDSGFPTLCAGTKREAWETIRTVQPPVCVLDLNLPDGSGLDVLRRIVQEGLPVRVIVMTAFPLQHLRPQYPDGTLTAWLTKPVPPEQLLDAVRQSLCEDQQSDLDPSVAH